MLSKPNPSSLLHREQTLKVLRGREAGCNTYGIHDAELDCELFIHEFEEWSSLYPDRPGNYESIRADPIVPEKLFSVYGIPYYLTIDIEVADIIVLWALSKLKNQLPKYLSFEVTATRNEALQILFQLNGLEYHLSQRVEGMA